MEWLDYDRNDHVNGNILQKINVFDTTHSSNNH